MLLLTSQYKFIYLCVLFIYSKIIKSKYSKILIIMRHLLVLDNSPYNNQLLCFQTGNRDGGNMHGWTRCGHWQAPLLAETIGGGDSDCHEIGEEGHRSNEHHEPRKGHLDGRAVMGRFGLLKFCCYSALIYRNSFLPCKFSIVVLLMVFSRKCWKFKVVRVCTVWYIIRIISKT